MKLVLRLRPEENRGNENLELTYVGHLWGFSSSPYSLVYVLGLPMPVVLCQAVSGRAGRDRLWQAQADCGRLWQAEAG